MAKKKRPDKLAGKVLKYRGAGRFKLVDSKKAKRSKAARKGVRTRKRNAAIVEKMYKQLIRLERKERRVTGTRVFEAIDLGDTWEIEVGMSYGPGGAE